ncbi:MAG: electron transport complex subunit RsxC [Candidatus Omnitrophica bacterium]|nr:electron transport complex subunit RsxC [Candidatus Omnitrophota bacterium]
MARIKEHKHSTEGKPIELAPLPSRVYISLAQHLGKVCDKLDVKVGDSVLRGQRLATSDAKIFAPVHASISGKVTAIELWPHPGMGKAKAVVIESDGLDKSSGREAAKSHEEISRLTAAQIRELVFKAGVVGMGGAAFPTYIKLTPPKPVSTLIVNIAECEPYLTGDSELSVEKTREILLGIELVKMCVGAQNVFIALEDNTPVAAKAMETAVRTTGYAIRVLKSRYPQGGEKQLIKSICKIEVPGGKLPFDVGVTVQNAATVYAVYEAVYLDKPLYERVVTVTGSIVPNPKNLLCRIGTPIKDLIDFCGPLTEEPAKIIIGGPMMGVAQFTDMVPVIKSTTGVILMAKNETETKEEESCVRCGACIRECPLGLMPCLINLAAEKGLWDEAKEYGALDCMECGLCSYMCPGNRRLVQSIRKAKLEIAKRKT